MKDGNFKARQWFLCVNEGAKCFKFFEEICGLLNNDTSTWAYIKHEPEKNSVTGDEKPFHYHAVLVFDNPRSFSSIQKKFQGAHIEKAINISDCSAYLLHNTERAKADGKKQYNIKDIVTNNSDMLKIWLGDKALRKPKFNPDRIVEYVVLDGLRGYTQFFMKYGAVVQKYMSSINCICNEYYNHVENQEWINKLFTAKRNVYNRYSAKTNNIQNQDKE